MKNKLFLIVLLLNMLLLAGCGSKTAEEAAVIEEQKYELVFSELMVKNNASFPATDGQFRDWAELYNNGSEMLDLGGFALKNGNKEQRIADGTVLESGEYICIFFDEISVSAHDRLSLVSPLGTTVAEILCPDTENGEAYARGDDGEYHTTCWATPGLANIKENYARLNEQRSTSSALIINEVCPASFDAKENRDWVEMKNVSDGELFLADYCLSDSKNESYALPEKTIAPGEVYVVFCDDEPADGTLPFSISLTETLYLTNADGECVDSIALHNIPIGGSMGRLPDKNGLYYFEAASRNEENFGGVSMISEAPSASEKPGVYDGIASLSVRLEGEGTIYYTIDGSTPTRDSAVYTEPITLNSTSVIRAAAEADGQGLSRTETFCYIINENHSLPVLSLAVDNPKRFKEVYNNLNTSAELPANLSYFDGETEFSANCGVTLKGKTSLSLDKKSLGVYFRNKYGDGAIDCDIFKNGITEYSSLSIRAGQDYTFSYIRNELCQQLALEGSGSLLTQESQYCVLYINGEYRGLYCLKENINEQFYASHAGVSAKSVEVQNAPPALSSPFYKGILTPAMNQDLSIEENYNAIAEQLDLDAFIDWILFEGWCGNTDTQGNLKFVRSSENDGLWRPVFYDLDWSFYGDTFCFSTVAGENGNCGVEMPWLVRSLMSNPDFRDKLLSRYAELIKTTLSNENVLNKIDEMAAEIAPEVERDRERWWLRYESWFNEINHLKDMISVYNWDENSVSRLCEAFYIRSSEREKYFG